MHATQTMQPASPQPPFATWNPWLLGDEPGRPLRAHGAVLGDLADLRELRDGSAYRRPWPAHHITGSGFSSPPTARTLFRTPWPRTTHAAARPWTRYGRDGQHAWRHPLAVLTREVVNG